MTDLNSFEDSNCPEIEEQGEYNNPQNDFYIDGLTLPFFNPTDNLFEYSYNNSFDNRPEIQFGDSFEQTPGIIEHINAKNITSPNENNMQLDQRKTSDKSKNNSNYISKDKDVKLDLNENNDRDGKDSLNQKAINITNPNTQKYIFNISKNKKLGRKRKNCCLKGVHDKYAQDNMIKKVKGMVINSTLLSFVNNSLIEEETDNNALKRKNNNEWKVNTTSILFKIDQNIIKNINREDSLNLLKLPLKEIYSNNISSKIKQKFENSNKKLIDEIYLNNQKKKSINILNMTLGQCMKHLSKKEYYPELQGLENEYEKIIKELKEKKETDEYIELFKYLLGSFEEIYKNKRIQKGKNRIVTETQK